METDQKCVQANSNSLDQILYLIANVMFLHPFLPLHYIATTDEMQVVVLVTSKLSSSKHSYPNTSPTGKYHAC